MRVDGPTCGPRSPGTELSGGRDTSRTPSTTPRLSTSVERRGLLRWIGAGAAGGFVAAAARPLASPIGHDRGSAPVVVDRPALDISGREPASAALQRMLDDAPDHATFVFPSGAVLNLDRTLRLTRPVHLLGSGELRFTAGIAGSPAISVEADGCDLQGLLVTNPNALGSATGPKSFGMWIAASAVSVTACTVSGFQNGIAVSPRGEFHDLLICENFVVDVLGAGGGPDDLLSDIGEDRGDGIVVWGASAVVANNRIVAKEGSDCRVGIHMEGLGGEAQRPYAHANELAVISGNVVSGTFRRGIVLESASAVSVTGNSVADSTWWGIAVINGAQCSVTSNSILWTRGVQDRQGAVWSPSRGPLMLYGEGRGHLLANNVLAVRGVADHGIRLQHRNTGSTDHLVSGNVLSVESTGSCVTAVQVSRAVGTRISGNQLSGSSQTGVRMTDCDHFSVDSNTCSAPRQGAGSASGWTGVLLEGAPGTGSVSANTITGGEDGVRATSRRAIKINDNLITAGGTAIDVTGSTGGSCSNNVFVGPTRMTMLGAGAGVSAVGNVTT